MSGKWRRYCLGLNVMKWPWHIWANASLINEVDHNMMQDNKIQQNLLHAFWYILRNLVKNNYIYEVKCFITLESLRSFNVLATTV